MANLTKGKGYYLSINSPERLTCNESHYFACYCKSCREKNFIPQTQAEEFVKNYLKENRIKWRFRDIIRLPKIRVEWGSGVEKITPLLTTPYESNTMENEDKIMKLKQTIIPNKKAERNKQILEKRAMGLSISEIGRMYGLTRQRIFNILKEYGDTLPKELSVDKK